MNKYKLEKVIGEGSFAKVYLVSSQKGEKFALKKILKRKSNYCHRIREIEAGVRTRKHHSIVNFQESFEDDHYVYMVFEYVEGMNLVEFMELRNYTPVAEPVAKSIFYQCVKALQHAHSKGVFHRDMKLENIMFTTKGKVKIIDFGLSAICNGKHPSEELVGSMEYCPPELLDTKSYLPPDADVFAIGVVLYSLLTGQLPFCGDERRGFLYGTRPHPTLRFPDVPISDEAKQLLKSMLALNPKERIGLKQIAKHKWLENVETSNLKSSVWNSVWNSLRTLKVS